MTFATDYFDVEEKLKNSILNGDTENVRKLLSDELAVVDPWLENIIQLAKNKDIKIIQSILINRIPLSINFYSIKQQEKLIVDLISELSHEIYAAGWYDGIEKRLWNWIEDSSTIPAFINKDAIQSDLIDLKSLSDNINLWAIRKNGKGEAIELSKWKEIISKK